MLMSAVIRFTWVVTPQSHCAEIVQLKFLASLWRRANARNGSFITSLRWPIHIINSVKKTQFFEFRAGLVVAVLTLYANFSDHISVESFIWSTTKKRKYIISYSAKAAVGVSEKFGVANQLTFPKSFMRGLLYKCTNKLMVFLTRLMIRCQVKGPSLKPRKLHPFPVLHKITQVTIRFLSFLYFFPFWIFLAALDTRLRYFGSCKPTNLSKVFYERLTVALRCVFLNVPLLP